MKNNSLYVVLVCIVLVLLGVWWYVQRPSSGGSAGPASDIGAAAETAASAQSSVSGAVGNTNPFGAEVNPLSGYQNPFGQ
ncbi:MAG: hypothetical protein WCT45_00650 [Candidatus Paceibacterota bacterium]|jgi:hypothetical protein